MNETVETITAVQALGVALSIPAGTMTMGECQDAAPAMLEHLQAMGFDIVQRELARALAESEKRVSKVIDAAERVMQWYDNHEPWTPGREFQALRSALDAAEEARWSEFDRAALLEGEHHAV